MPNRPSNIDAELQAEIDAALGDLSVEELMELEEPKARAGTGRETKLGTVVSVHGGDVLVEFGPKTSGVCPLAQFDEPPAPGDKLEFVVERFDRDEGLYALARKGAVSKAEWESLEVGQVVEARCTGTNKGGLEMEVAAHRAFMPAGQVAISHVEDLAVFVGEKLPSEVIELDKQRGRIVLSRRRVMEAQRAQQRDETLKTLKVNQEVSGTVTSLQPYGAFVDIGGVDGLVHVSDLSHKRIGHPRDVVNVGDHVNVKVLKIEGEGDDLRIGLGLKQTMADPFQTKAGDIVEGGTVTGKVTNLVDFGAFVEIAPGVEGLIHISELANERVRSVSAVLKEGEIVTAKVLSVDRDRQRISLSLKALKQEREEEQLRDEDPRMRKLREKFSGNLKGGLG